MVPKQDYNVYTKIYIDYVMQQCKKALLSDAAQKIQVFLFMNKRVYNTENGCHLTLNILHYSFIDKQTNTRDVNYWKINDVVPPFIQAQIAVFKELGVFLVDETITEQSYGIYIYKTLPELRKSITFHGFDILPHYFDDFYLLDNFRKRKNETYLPENKRTCDNNYYNRYSDSYSDSYSDRYSDRYNYRDRYIDNDRDSDRYNYRDRYIDNDRDSNRYRDRYNDRYIDRCIDRDRYNDGYRYIEKYNDKDRYDDIDRIVNNANRNYRKNHTVSFNMSRNRQVTIVDNQSTMATVAAAVNPSNNNQDAINQSTMASVAAVNPS